MYTKNPERQELQVALFDIDYSDIEDTAQNEVIDLPAGAIIVGGDITVISAMDASITLDLGLAIGESADADLFTSTAFACDATAGTRSALTSYAKEITNPREAITAQFSAVPTQGKVRIRVEYIRVGRSCYNY